MGRTVPSSLMQLLAGSLHCLNHSVLQRTACNTPAGFPRATNLGWGWGSLDGTRLLFVACHHVCHLLLITQASSGTTWEIINTVHWEPFIAILKAAYHIHCDFSLFKLDCACVERVCICIGPKTCEYFACFSVGLYVS